MTRMLSRSNISTRFVYTCLLLNCVVGFVLASGRTSANSNRHFLLSTSPDLGPFTRLRAKSCNEHRQLEYRNDVPWDAFGKTDVDDDAIGNANRQRGRQTADSIEQN